MFYYCCNSVTVIWLLLYVVIDKSSWFERTNAVRRYRNPYIPCTEKYIFRLF